MELVRARILGLIKRSNKFGLLNRENADTVDINDNLKTAITKSVARMGKVFGRQETERLTYKTNEFQNITVSRLKLNAL